MTIESKNNADSAEREPHYRMRPRPASGVLDLSMRHSPPLRRWLVRCGLGLSLLIAVSRVALMPWSWQFLPDHFIQALFVVVFLPSLWLLWHERRRVFPQGCCRNCGYDLTGNASGICSECGEPIRPTDAAR